MAQDWTARGPDRSSFPAAGSVVIRQGNRGDRGDRGDRYYVLVSGAVRVEREGRHLRDPATSGAGFGEVAPLRDVPRTASH